jgi:hypothetical protein
LCWSHCLVVTKQQYANNKNKNKTNISVNNVCMQGGDEEGGGSDIGALLGNLGPLIGGLSGVSYL